MDIMLKAMLDYVKNKKFKGHTEDSFYKMVRKHKKSITKIVKDFSYEEHISTKEYKSALKSLFEGELDVMSNYEIFIIADALGCDDLGLRMENEELDFIYQTIFTYWRTLTKVYSDKQKELTVD